MCKHYRPKGPPSGAPQRSGPDARGTEGGTRAEDEDRTRDSCFPMIQPYIYVALAVRSLDISRAYDVVRIMTDGGPAHRTELVWTYITRIVTDQNDLGLGTAMGMVTVVVAFAFTVYLFRQLLKVRYRR
jgi:ABC-type sugar transport system permease subunit